MVQVMVADAEVIDVAVTAEITGAAAAVVAKVKFADVDDVFEALAERGISGAGTGEEGYARGGGQQECGMEQSLFAAWLGLHS